MCAHTYHYQPFVAVFQCQHYLSIPVHSILVYTVQSLHLPEPYIRNLCFHEKFFLSHVGKDYRTHTRRPALIYIWLNWIGERRGGTCRLNLPRYYMTTRRNLSQIKTGSGNHIHASISYLLVCRAKLKTLYGNEDADDAAVVCI
jgi:hypothetical protein